MMKVLSLCDGMSCGRIALERAGIEVEQYFAAEIKEIGIKVTKENYPDTIHIGDVNKITFKDGVLYTEKGNFDVGHIDLVMFGSPCQTFSIAMPKEQRTGLENLKKSGLFYQCNRVLKEVNPTYFFMENVASMNKEDVKTISDFLGVEPIKIDSQLIAPALRKRWYWSNIPDVAQPIPKEINLQDILVDGYADRLKARNLLVSDSRPLTTPVKMFHRYWSTGFTTLIFKSEEHFKDCVKEYERISGEKRKIKAKDLDDYDGHVFDGVRYLYQEELEKCQTVPEGYTKCLTRNEAADVLGDGWTVDVIAHIFTYLKQQESEEKEMKLDIKPYNPVEQILFNYEELKTEIQAKAETYKTLVYTDENIKEAKADKAALNKLKKALNDERIKREKEYMQPFNDFKAKINELIRIIDEPIGIIDKQIKEVDEQKKAKKLNQIQAYWNNVTSPEHPLTLQRVMNPKWLNATASMKSVQDEINGILAKYAEDIATLQNLPEYGFEAIEAYKVSLDLRNAMNEAHRLSEMAKRKAEAERLAAERKAEQERQRAEEEAKKHIEEFENDMRLQNEALLKGCEMASMPPAELPFDGFENEKPTEPVREAICFRAYLTPDDALALKDFFNSRGIPFEAI